MAAGDGVFSGYTKYRRKDGRAKNQSRNYITFRLCPRK